MLFSSLVRGQWGYGPDGTVQALVTAVVTEAARVVAGTEVGQRALAWPPCTWMTIAEALHRRFTSMSIFC